MMGSALARGLTQAGAMLPSNITLYDLHSLKAQQLAHELGEGARAASTPADAVAGADLVLIAVKPPVVASALESIAGSVKSSHLIISIAAGVRIAKMEALVPA